MTEADPSRPDLRGSRRLAGRIAVITGASRGIGAAVARRFAAEGARLVLVARTVGGLEEVDDSVRGAGGEPAVLVPHDLRDGDGLDRLGASLFERFGRLDILVGAAGVLGMLSPLGHVTPKVWDEVMAVNVTANWRLIRSLDPLLRQAEAGRAIFATASAHIQGRAYWGPYAVSKAALESLVRCYAAELVKTRVRANLVVPPPTHTSLRGHAFPGEDPGRLAAPEEVTETFVELAEPACRRHGETVVVGADQAAAEAATEAQR